MFYDEPPQNVLERRREEGPVTLRRAAHVNEGDCG